MRHAFTLLIMLFLGVQSSAKESHVTFLDIAETNPNTVYIPFKLTGRLITVEAQIDSIKGNFILDTGADKLILNNQYFENLKSQKAGFSASTTGNLQARKTLIDTLLWDKLTLPDLTAELVDLRHLENKKNIRLIGILGYDVFKEYEVFLDFQMNVIVLSKLNQSGERIDSLTIANVPYDSISFDLIGHAIVLSVKVNGVAFRCALDSGAELNLLDRRIKKKVLRNFDVLRRVTMSGVGEGEVEMLAGILRNVQIGNLNSKGMRTLLTNIEQIRKAFGASINGVLGYEFLFNKRTLINYKKKKLFFYKPQMT